MKLVNTFPNDYWLVELLSINIVLYFIHKCLANFNIYLSIYNFSRLFVLKHDINSWHFGGMQRKWLIILSESWTCLANYKFICIIFFMSKHWQLMFIWMFLKEKLWIMKDEINKRRNIQIINKRSECNLIFLIQSKIFHPNY